MRIVAVIAICMSNLCTMEMLCSQQTARRERKVQAPEPTFENERYGPYERNLFDIWLPMADKPTPLIVHIHGGGFTGGRKEGIRFTRDVSQALDHGVAFASIQYRLRADGDETLNDPQRTGIQNILRDCARAIQYIRAHSSKYNLDKSRVACYGNSAGAGTSIWLAFHDDLAMPASNDPVLRESSRVVAAGMRAGQFTYDIERWDTAFKRRGGDLLKTHGDGSGQSKFWQFFGLTEQQYRGQEGKKWRADVDMERLITSDDPPVCILTNNPDVPVTTRGIYNHHPLHAELIEQACERAGVEVLCLLPKVRKADADRIKADPDIMLHFLIAHLDIEPRHANASANPDRYWKKHVIQPAERTEGLLNTAAASDFDRDGHLDVISSYNGAVVLHMAPDWRPVVVHRFRESDSRNKPRSGCIHSCLMDVDLDGDQDFCGSNNTVFWLECPADPEKEVWKYRTIDDEILGTHCLITGDVDGDGRVDLIANSGRTAGTPFPDSLTWQKVPPNPRTASHWIRNVFAAGDAPGGSHYTGIADVDGDGKADISCAAKGGEGFPNGEWFAWWQQPADGSMPWRKHLLSDNQPGATNIHPIDLNGDGHIDFAATRGHGSGILWFRGPRFDPIEIDSRIKGPHCLVSVDLDDDDDIDLATCGRDEDGVCAWYENDGNGSFTKRVIGIDQGSYDLRAVDLDADTDLDLLVAGHTSRNIVWYENPRID